MTAEHLRCVSGHRPLLTPPAALSRLALEQLLVLSVPGRHDVNRAPMPQRDRNNLVLEVGLQPRAPAPTPLLREVTVTSGRTLRTTRRPGASLHLSREAGAHGRPSGAVPLEQIRASHARHRPRPNYARVSSIPKLSSTATHAAASRDNAGGSASRAAAAASRRLSVHPPRPVSSVGHLVGLGR